ncbi:MAG: hypothetical protein HON94_11325 [Methylococcales bacterium]|jgi:hypothetical protein|nr:hypothetical protein [Methylococcales bacterium]
MAKKKQESDPQYIGGGYQVTLTRDFQRLDGKVIPAGRTFYVTGDFYTQLKSDGYLEKKIDKQNKIKIKE